MIRTALLALVGCALLWACREAPAPAPPVANPALWVVEDASGAQVAWLFGTIHALPDGARWEGPEIAKAVADAGVLVVEVRDLDPARIAPLFARMARDEPVPPLAQRIDPSQQRALDAAIARAPRAAHALDKLETWAAALILTRSGVGLEGENGADRALIARFADRPIVELEGAAAQLDIFDSLPERDQRLLLNVVLAEAGRDPAKGARELAEAWLSGDLASLERATRTGLLAEPVLEQALASGRNAAWLEQVTPLIAAGRRPLIAVGAAHMLGPRGLPTLLTRAGYRVRRSQ